MASESTPLSTNTKPSYILTERTAGSVVDASPFLTPKGVIHNELFYLEQNQLKSHPAFRSEWQDGRNMTVPSAVFNLVCTIIGGGVLSLPFVMKKAGVIIGPLLVIVMAVSCDWSIYILLSCARRTGAKSYKEVTEIAFGKSAGIIVTASIFALCYLIVIAYGILLRDIVTAIAQLTGGINENPSMTTQNLIMLVCVLFDAPLCTLKSLNALRFTSAFSLGAVTTLALCLTYHTFKSNSSFSFKQFSDKVQIWPNSFWDCLYVFSITCVAFVCHFNVVPIHCDLMIPSRSRIKFVVHTTMTICSFMYCFIGLAGYFVFFDATEDNIFLNFSAHDPAITVGRIALTISIMMAYPLLTIPARDSFHALLFSANQTFVPSRMVVPAEATRGFRIGEAIVLCGSAYAVSASVKTVATVWNFLGSTVGILVACVFPAALYLRIRQPRVHSSMTVPAWVLLVFGVSALIMCTYEAIRSL
eukprot:c8543_g1_i1.p1 GENE.c8543_g1_i1~~c8543_g1_i1.p1  ORF type:complete len:482 (-),score=108.17 c8543_g1_i1:135-1553(-)